VGFIALAGLGFACILPNRLFGGVGDFVMAKNKDIRGVVKLQSTESSHCYYTQKNRRNVTEKLELKKYDPTLRKHVLYKEAKM
jgi:large subunit ribosomal protein L33